MKKLLKFIRNILVFVCWTSLFTIASNLLIKLIWNFNFMSTHSWNVFSSFWNQDGIFKTTSDILLLATLFLSPILWLVGFILVLRFDYLSIFMWPFKLILRPFEDKESPESKRIILKNIKSNEQLAEEIKAEIESSKPKETKEAGNLRSAITQKLTAEINKQLK